MNKCLYCYRPLEKGETDFHAKCAKKFFGTERIPALDYTCDELEKPKVDYRRFMGTLYM